MIFNKETFGTLLLLTFNVKIISCQGEIFTKSSKHGKNAALFHEKRNEEARKTMELEKTTERRNKISICSRTDSNKLVKAISEENSKRRQKRRIPLDMVCPRGETCEHNEKLDAQNCYCDAACVEFKDCCYRYYRSNVSNEIFDIILYKDYMTCRLDSLPGALSSFRGYWMVTKCPETYSLDVVSARCNNLTKGDIPVTDKRGIIYGNVYCAHCHRATNYIPWTVRLSVEKRSCYRHFPGDPLTEKNLLSSSRVEHLRNSSCTFVYIPPNKTRPRTCYTSLSRPKETEICQNHLNPVIVNHRFKYRNPYCVDNWFKMECIEDGFPYNKNTFMFPLTILFTVSLPRFDEENPCSPYHQLNQETGMCLPEICEEDRDTCESRTSDPSIRNYVLEIHLLLASDSIIDTNISGRALSLFTTCLPNQQYDLYYKQNSGIFLYNLRSNISTPIQSVINATFAYFVRKNVAKKELLNLKLRIDKMEWKYTRRFLLPSNTKTIKIWRTWNPFNLHQSFESTTFSWSGSLRATEHLNDLENLNDLPLLDNVPSKCNVEIEDVNRTEKKFYMTNFDFQMDSINASKPVLKNNITFSVNSGDQFAQGLLTYVTLSVSCGAAIPTIIVHRYVKLVSSTPGIITEQTLLVSFLFSICFMSGIVGKANHILCFSIAVLTHYLILSFFTWISIFVGHTLKQLQNIKRVKQNPPFKKPPFPKTYFVVGYLLPLLIIIPPAIIELCGCTNIEIGYTTSACFPTGYPANLIIVVIPLLFFILFHLFCLSYSGWHLFRMSQKVTRLSVSTSRSYVGVYIRLCLISGLSWGLGVLSEALDNDIFRYVFILLSGSHGLIFTLCIVSTKTFRQSFREKMLTSSQSPEQIEMDVVLNGSETPTNDGI